MRLWEDGFDHYGTDTAKMLDGPYAQASQCALSSTHFVTGERAIFLNGNGGLFNPEGVRKVLPTAIDKIGVAGRFWFNSLPNNAYESIIFDFISTNLLQSQMMCTVDANGAIRFVRGKRTYQDDGSSLSAGGVSGTLVTQTDPIITAGAFSHIEIQMYIHATLGWIRVAVNSIHRFQATNLNTQFDTTKIASVMQRKPYLGSTDNGDFYMDDYYMYDFTGNSAVDTDFCPTVDGSGIGTNYIGELQVWPLYVNGDTSQAAWQKSTGVTGYTLIDEHSPDDTDYIFSTAANDLSEFALDDLPSNITYVRGLGIHARLSKSDSGAAMTKVGMKSVATSLDAAERPVTTIPTYWRDMENIDPNTSAATGTLTFTGQPANGDTVTIGAKTYTFQTVLTNVDGNVFIGANLAASISNLAAAITLGAGSGTAYAAATTLNTDVTATAGATTLVITAKVGGTSGNSITTTETSANASWGGATMSGGSAGSRWTRAALNAAWMRLIRSF